MASTTTYRPSSYTPFPPSTATFPTTSKPSASPLFIAAQKKKAMSITQTYYLAHKARAKLASEAARADHDLRLLVGHANLLDSLMFELADAEREQESWFNQSVRGAARHEEQPQPLMSSPVLEEKPQQQERHIQWADTIQDTTPTWQSVDLDSDESDLYDESDYDSDDDVEMVETLAPRPAPAAFTTTTVTTTAKPNAISTIQSKPILALEDEDEDEDMEEDDLEDDYSGLELTRTVSHPASPPELEADLSDVSDSDSMPPSPPNVTFTFSEKDAKEQMEQDQDERNSLYTEGFYIPRRNSGSLISAISVY